MKITQSKLRKIIREELDAVTEEKSKARKDAEKAGHISKAFDRDNEFQLDPEYKEKAAAMRKRVAKMKGEMNEAVPKPTHRGKVKNKDGRVGMVSNTRKDKLGLMMTVVYRDGKTPKQETLYASDLEVA